MGAGHGPTRGARAIELAALLCALIAGSGCAGSGRRLASNAVCPPARGTPDVWSDPASIRPADLPGPQARLLEATAQPEAHPARLGPRPPLEPAVVVPLSTIQAQAAKERVRTAEIQTKSIYGPDDRRDLSPGVVTELEQRAPRDPRRVGTPQEWAKQVLAASRAVALVVEAKELTREDDGGFSLASQTYTARVETIHGAPLCAAPRAQFQAQPTAGFCTAWLAGPALVVTARHCVAGLKVTDLAFVFGWQELDEGRFPGTPARLKAAQVYRGVRYRALGSGTEDGDFAVVELDRPVPPEAKIAPLALRRTGRPRMGEPLYLLGCPRGLPLKFADGASVRAVNRRLPLLRADLDAFQGNSGSPVLSGLDHRVVGILVRGQSDIVVVGDPPCAVEVRTNFAQGGETVLGSVAFARYVP